MDKYEIPSNLVDVPLEEFALLDVYPDASRLQIKVDKRRGYIRIYRVCYLDRLYHDSKIDYPEIQCPYQKVNVKSLSRSRVDAINKLILNEGFNHRDVLKGVVFALDDIDRKGMNPDFCDVENMKIFYAQYTRSLIDKINESAIGEKPMNRTTARLHQRGLCHFIAAHNYDSLTYKQVEHWAKPISTKETSGNNFKVGISDDTHSKVYAFHYQMFNTYTEAVIKRAGDGFLCRPLVSRTKDIIGEDFVFLARSLHTLIPDTALNRKKKALILSMFSGEGYTYQGDPGVTYSLMMKQGELYKANPEVMIQEKHNDFERNPHFSETDIIIFFSRAMRHFAFLMAYETGGNQTQIFEADYNNIIVNKANRGVRAYKSRAGNKEVMLSWSLKNFGPVIKRYQQSIGAIEKLIGQAWEEAGIPIIYILSDDKKGKISKGFKDVNLESMATVGRVSKLNFIWPEKLPYINISDARPFRDINIVKKTGNVAVAAQLQGRTIETTRKIYLRKMGLIDAAIELAPFLKALGDAGRASSSGAKLYIDDSAKNTPSGGCVAPENCTPEVAEGFDEMAPEPKCTAMTTCFFCKYYAIHSDKQDIKKVLSVREFLKLSGRLNSNGIDEFTMKFSPMLHRIDEIIEQFSELGNEQSDIVKECLAEIESDDLDPFWENAISSLIDVMEEGV